MFRSVCTKWSRQSIRDVKGIQRPFNSNSNTNSAKISLLSQYLPRINAYTGTDFPVVKQQQHQFTKYSTTCSLKNSSSDKKPIETSSSSSSSSSYLDTFQSEAAKWWNSSLEMTSQMVESSTNIVKDTASKTFDSTQKLTQDVTNQATKTASETFDSGWKSLDQVTQQTTRHIQDTTSNLVHTAAEAAKDTASALAKSTTEALSNTTVSVGHAAQDAIQKSANATKEATSQAVKHTIHRPLKATAETISETSQQLVDNITSSGTKVIKWVFWWSLAAVFVYGLATTLPIALIRYMMEGKNSSKEDNRANTDVHPLNNNQHQSQGNNEASSFNDSLWRFFRRSTSSTIPSNQQSTIVSDRDDLQGNTNKTSDPSSRSIFRWWA